MAGTVLNNCIIEYAGSNTGIGAISVENTSIPSVTNCTIRYSGSFGISLKNASPRLTNNVFTNNAGVDVKML
jgi:parallel beta-helix repeat protein